MNFDNLIKYLNRGKKITIDSVDLESIKSAKSPLAKILIASIGKLNQEFLKEIISKLKSEGENEINFGELVSNHDLVRQFPLQGNFDIVLAYDFILENREIFGDNNTLILLSCLHIFHKDRLFETSLEDSFVDTYDEKEFFLSCPLFFNATKEKLETFFNTTGRNLRINFDFDKSKNNDAILPPLQIFQFLLNNLRLNNGFKVIDAIVDYAYKRDKIFEKDCTKILKFDLLDFYITLENEPIVLDEFQILRNYVYSPGFDSDAILKNTNPNQDIENHYIRNILATNQLLWYKKKWSYNFFSKLVETKKFKCIGKLTTLSLGLIIKGPFIELMEGTSTNTKLDLKRLSFVVFLSNKISNDIKTQQLMGSELTLKETVLKRREETRKLIRGTTQALHKKFPENVIVEIIIGSLPWERIMIGIDNFEGDYKAREDRIINYIEYELYIASQLEKKPSNKKGKKMKNIITWIEYITSFVYGKKRIEKQTSSKISNDDKINIIEKIKPIFQKQ